MRANERTSGPVLQSVFLAVIDHSDVVISILGQRCHRRLQQDHESPKRRSRGRRHHRQRVEVGQAIGHYAFCILFIFSAVCIHCCFFLPMQRSSTGESERRFGELFEGWRSDQINDRRRSRPHRWNDRQVREMIE